MATLTHRYPVTVHWRGGRAGHGELTTGRTGVAVALVRGLSVGTHELTVTYTGNDAVEASSDTVTVRVTSPHGPHHR